MYKSIIVGLIEALVYEKANNNPYKTIDEICQDVQKEFPDIDVNWNLIKEDYMNEN